MIGRVKAAVRDVRDPSTGHVRVIDGPYSPAEKRRIAAFGVAFVPTLITYALTRSFVVAVAVAVALSIATKTALAAWKLGREE